MGSGAIFNADGRGLMPRKTEQTERAPTALPRAGGHIDETGVFRGKRALLSLTTGGPADAYRPDGFNGDIYRRERPLRATRQCLCGPARAAGQGSPEGRREAQKSVTTTLIPSSGPRSKVLPLNRPTLPIISTT